jgi:hypothetical protein
MNQEQEKNCIYFYFDTKGRKLYTPNYEFAYFRAKLYGTGEVFEIEL